MGIQNQDSDISIGVGKKNPEVNGQSEGEASAGTPFTNPGIEKPKVPAIPFLIVLLITGIFLAEVVAMLTIEVIHPALYQYMILLDAVIMVVLILPMIYFLTLRPLIANIEAREKLRLSYAELELRVQERTVELRKRKEAERRLRLQTTAIEAAANGIVITDPQGSILWINPAIMQMTGYSESELIGRNMRVFKSGMHSSDFYRQMWHTIQAGQVWHGETNNRRKDGSLYIEDQIITPVQDDSGQITQYIAIKHDVTEHKHMEAALELERARLKNILDTMPEGVYIVNQNYQVEYANPVIEREFGPVDGQKCFAYFHCLEEPCSWCLNEKVFAGIPFAGERTYARNNKTYELFDAPLVNLDKSVSKLKILHDITQRKNMELALKRSNRELQVASNAERNHRQFAEALVAAAFHLNSSQHLDEVLKIILEQIKNVIHYQFANIGLLDGDSFYEAACQGEANLAGLNARIMKRYRLGDFPLLKKMSQDEQPILIMDTAREPDWIVVEDFEWCRSFLSVPLIIEEKMIGFVNLFAGQTAFYDQDMCDRLAAFTTHAATAIRNAMLFEQVQASSKRLQFLSRRLVEVQEAERLSISRELHDEAGQMLTSLMLDLRLLEKKVHHPETILKKIDEMGDTLNTVQENLHDVAMALRPASLDHLGLDSALRQQIEFIGEKYDLQVSFRSAEIHHRLAPDVESGLYRIVQEALTNIVRHANATEADVVMMVRDDRLVIVIEDNGNGFNPDEIQPGEHLGVLSMRERADMLGGKLIIESAPGKGTTVLVEVDYDDSNIDR